MGGGMGKVDINNLTVGTESADVVCPRCGHSMKIRLRKVDKQKFWGCTEFPDCVGGRNLNEGIALLVQAQAAKEAAEAAKPAPTAVPWSPAVLLPSDDVSVKPSKKLGSLAAKIRPPESAQPIAPMAPSPVSPSSPALARTRARGYAPKGKDVADLGWLGLVRPYED